MRSSSVGMMCLAILCVCRSVNADELTKTERAAQDFSYQGVTIGTTLEDFKTRFPTAKPQESDKPNVTAMYAPLSNRGKFIVVEFLHGTVYYMGVTFSSTMLSGLGGRQVLEKRITTKFGYPNRVDGRMSYWRFPNVNRKIGYKQSADGSSTLLIIDTAVEKKRRELDLGL